MFPQATPAWEQDKITFTGKKSLDLSVILKDGENPAFLKAVLQEVLGNMTKGYKMMIVIVNVMAPPFWLFPHDGAHDFGKLLHLSQIHLPLI